ncbi:MAG: hypothetical protein WCL32_20515, partial [Planctomycetota bacterium]
AQRTGVGERTIHRWRTDSTFRQLVRSHRAAMTERALGRLADGMTEAAETLRSLLRGEGESVRLNAAKAILEIGNKFHELQDIDQRIGELERLLSEKQL